jgi:hypothetical protein
MRSRIAALAVTALASATPLVPITAQSLPLLHPIRVGVVAGASFAKVDGQGLSQISNRDGALGGLTLGVGLAGGWSLQTGALYSMKGWTHREPGTGDGADVDIDYVELPALLRYDFSNASPVTPYLEGGAGFSIRSACKLVLVDGASGATQGTSCDDAERLSGGSIGFHSFDTGVLGGGGVSVQLGRTALTASLRYEAGLMSVEKTSNSKSRVLTFAVGISRPITF